jgi:hypothetical protein
VSLRLPGRIEINRASAATGLQPIEQEILGEMASSLGHAGRKAEVALAKLAAEEAGLRRGSRAAPSFGCRGGAGLFRPARTVRHAPP